MRAGLFRWDWCRKLRWRRDRGQAQLEAQVRGHMEGRIQAGGFQDLAFCRADTDAQGGEALGGVQEGFTAGALAGTAPRFTLFLHVELREDECRKGLAEWNAELGLVQIVGMGQVAGAHAAVVEAVRVVPRAEVVRARAIDVGARAWQTDPGPTFKAHEIGSFNNVCHGVT